MLCASIFMYFEITFAISVFIISIISGEQFTLSDINRIFNLSFAISLELFLLKMFPKPIRYPSLLALAEKMPVTLVQKEMVFSKSMNGISFPNTLSQIFWYALPAMVLFPTRGSP